MDELRGIAIHIGARSRRRPGLARSSCVANGEESGGRVGDRVPGSGLQDLKGVPGGWRLYSTWPRESLRPASNVYPGSRFIALAHQVDEPDLCRFVATRPHFRALAPTV
jgi:hypothetical protein